VPEADVATAAEDPVHEPTVELWGLLAQPINPWTAAEALLGMSQGAARMLASILLLSSPEAAATLDAMPAIIRSLSVGTVGRSERSAGGVRGPILWGETIAAQSASAGSSSTFVYTVAERAYDTPENRLLTAALRALAAAGDIVDVRALRARDPRLAALVATRAGAAHRWLEHRALAAVATTRPQPRDRQHARLGRRRRQYEAVDALLRRSQLALAPSDLALLADPATRAQHRGVVVLVRALRERGHAVGPLSTHRGVIDQGPLSYVHPRCRQARATGAAGIVLNGHPVDVPAVVDGHLVRVGDDDRPGHLFLGKHHDALDVIRAAGL
jgi:hypothetical protein